MKKISIKSSLAFLLLASLITMGMKKVFYPGHRYAMTLTGEDWSARIQFLDNAKTIMKTSSQPGNVISAWQDSVSKFQDEIRSQIGPQVVADTLAKPKK